MEAKIDSLRNHWELPAVAHFCSLFREVLELIDFDIEDFEEALITDTVASSEGGRSSLIVDLLVGLLRGCTGRKEVSLLNYNLYLHSLLDYFWLPCGEGPYNPLGPTPESASFHVLPVYAKLRLLHWLTEHRLYRPDIEHLTRNLSGDSLRIQPLGLDNEGNTYWYFYGTRLYKEAPELQDYPDPLILPPSPKPPVASSTSPGTPARKSARRRRKPDGFPVARRKKRKTAVAAIPQRETEVESPGLSGCEQTSDDGEFLSSLSSSSVKKSPRRSAIPANVGTPGETPTTSQATTEDDESVCSTSKKAGPRASRLDDSSFTDIIQRMYSRDRDEDESSRMSETSTDAEGALLVNSLPKVPSLTIVKSKGDSSESWKAMSTPTRTPDPDHRMNEVEQEKTPVVPVPDSFKTELTPKMEGPTNGDEIRTGTTDHTKPTEATKDGDDLPKLQGEEHLDEPTKNGENGTLSTDGLSGCKAKRITPAVKEPRPWDQPGLREPYSTRWSLVCSTMEDWNDLAENFKKSKAKIERELYNILIDEFLPAIQDLFHQREKERLKQLIELAPRRTSDRIEVKKLKQEKDAELLARRENEEKERLAKLELERQQKLLKEQREQRLREREKDKDKLGKVQEKAREERGKRLEKRNLRLQLQAEGKPIPPELLMTQEEEDEEESDDEMEVMYEKLENVFDAIQKSSDAWPFIEPVTEEIAPGYFDLIKEPMDLSTIDKKLANRDYDQKLDFIKDLNTMFLNCCKYNGIANEYTKLAQRLERVLITAWKKNFPPSNLAYISDKKRVDSELLCIEHLGGLAQHIREQLEADQGSTGTIIHMGIYREKVFSITSTEYKDSLMTKSSGSEDDEVAPERRPQRTPRTIVSGNRIIMNPMHSYSKPMEPRPHVPPRILGRYPQGAKTGTGGVLPPGFTAVPVSAATVRPNSSGAHIVPIGQSGLPPSGFPVPKFRVRNDRDQYCKSIYRGMGVLYYDNGASMTLGSRLVILPQSSLPLLTTGPVSYVLPSTSLSTQPGTTTLSSSITKSTQYATLAPQPYSSTTTVVTASMDSEDFEKNLPYTRLHSLESKKRLENRPGTSSLNMNLSASPSSKEPLMIRAKPGGLSTTSTMMPVRLVNENGASIISLGNSNSSKFDIQSQSPSVQRLLHKAIINKKPITISVASRPVRAKGTTPCTNITPLGTLAIPRSSTSPTKQQQSHHELSSSIPASQGQAQQTSILATSSTSAVPTASISLSASELVASESDRVVMLPDKKHCLQLGKDGFIYVIDTGSGKILGKVSPTDTAYAPLKQHFTSAKPDTAITNTPTNTPLSPPPSGGISMPLVGTSPTKVYRSITPAKPVCSVQPQPRHIPIQPLLASPSATSVAVTGSTSVLSESSQSAPLQCLSEGQSAQPVMILSSPQIPGTGTAGTPTPAFLVNLGSSADSSILSQHRPTTLMTTAHGQTPVQVIQVLQPQQIVLNTTGQGLQILPQSAAGQTQSAGEPGPGRTFVSIGSNAGQQS